MRLLFLFLSLICACIGQELNGYINPIWVMGSRGRGRALNSRYLTNNVYREPRVITDLVYMDENGRYHPVYRQERMYRSQAAEPYYRDNEQYMPLASEQNVLQADNV
ncbi:uncharacterized protein LOC106667696 [Cimex lectularius]|uniref:CPR type cuticle protein n=1 Tax=Cimex lectularius TaxID=79782 RepID=A0A8I6RTM2_CIMLE|nr:uncharacterized protein LOC106667696 [Cimex lectularius]